MGTTEIEPVPDSDYIVGVTTRAYTARTITRCGVLARSILEVLAQHIFRHIWVEAYPEGAH